MTNRDPIETVYVRTSEATLATWSNNQGPGRAKTPSYHRRHLGVTTGERFTPCDWIEQCHHEALKCAEDDARIDVLPRECLHFTFLALANHDFPMLSDLPAELDVLRSSYHRLVRGVQFSVHDVRLLPLRNALVLAGIPNDESFRARADFASELLAGPWSPLLRKRYAGLEIPPLFWHTTLLRYDTEYMPMCCREIYNRYADRTMAVIGLGVPKLLATSYNWGTRIEL